MKKIFVLMLIVCIGSFIYSAYDTTDRYAKAVRSHDGKTVSALTDVIAYRDSLKESLRPLIAESLRQRYGASVPANRLQAEVLAGVMRIEKQLDLNFTAANIQKQIESANEKSKSEGFEFVSKGWRSPITFVVLDNMDAKSIFEFQGLSGWKLVREESSKERLRKILDREIGPRGK